MADDKDTDIINLAPSDLLGIIQRALMELHHYCGQHPQGVDPAVIFAYLEKTAQFAGQLPRPAMPANGTQAQAEARKN